MGLSDRAASGCRRQVAGGGRFALGPPAQVVLGLPLGPGEACSARVGAIGSASDATSAALAGSSRFCGADDYQRPLGFRVAHPPGCGCLPPPGRICHADTGQRGPSPLGTVANVPACGPSAFPVRRGHRVQDAPVRRLPWCWTRSGANGSRRG